MNMAITSQEVELTLIEKAQEGDRQAFGELVNSHRQGVLNVVYRMSGDIHFAEDIAQEAFIRAWQKLPGYRPNAPFKHWVYRIATNAALDAFRKQRDTLDVEDLQLAAPGSGLEAGLVSQDRAEVVQQAFLALPEASRAVLVLREFEGLSYQEIAETLAIPLGTVMSRLNYGRNLLREQLSPLMEEL